MKKTHLFIIMLIGFSISTNAQQFSLTHSKTLYDSFENPAVSSYTPEQSFKYNISILPSIFLDFKIKGDAETALKSVLFGKDIDKSSFNSLNNELNRLNINFNGYLFMFKILKTAEYQREMGISLRLKDDGNYSVSNMAIVLPYSGTVFEPGNYPNQFISHYQNTSYWQLGLSYRENYNSKLGFGAKLGLLSGASFSKMDINESLLEARPADYTLHLNGHYVNSHGADTLGTSWFMPDFKNPGISLSLGTSYRFNNNIYLTGHIKDAGFILWSKKTPSFTFNDSLTVSRTKSTDSTYRQLYTNKMREMLERNESSSSAFTSKLNTQIELAASRQFGNFKPVVMVSKNAFNSDGFIALQNNYVYRSLNLALNAAYYLNTGWNFGGMFMIKSANVDFYLGTEKLFPTYNLTKAYTQKDENIGKSPTQANIFLGFSFKFGRIMQTMPFADFVDGLNDKETGYVYKLSKKEKRALKRRKK
ncbi:DUF5723 family protein [Pseudopedobacter beijingensis]|uniref:DUF5723 family protein n=1 Tax=Pseudopedobacter beijingensis TaxID=1207056 RepID=A0ABW4III1_9SPHI